MSAALVGALKEVIAKFDLDISGADKKAKALDTQITKLTDTLGALAGAFVGSKIVHGIREFIEGQIEAGSAVNDLGEKLGVGTDDLQAFQFAAGLAGVSAEEAGKALEHLNRNVGEALDGNKGAAEAFAKLGIALKDGGGNVRETSDLLPELADAFAGMGSDAERTAAAMKVFGKSGASLLPMLKGGAKGASEMLAEFNRLGGGMSKEFITAADAAGDEIDKVKFAFNGFKSQIVFAILPAVTKVSKILQNGIGILRRTAKETNLAKGAWVLFGAGSVAASAKAAAGFGKFLGVLPKNAGFWKSVLGLGQIGLVIAAVALLYLAFDDFFTFLTGGESVIGDIIEGLFGVGSSKAVIEEVNQFLSEIGQTLMALEPLVDEFGKIFADIWPYLKLAIAGFARFMLERIGVTIKSIVWWIRTMTSTIGKQLQELGRFGAIAGEYLGNAKLKEMSVAVAATGVKMQDAVRAPEAGVENTAWVPQRRLGAEGTTVNQTNQVTNNITGVKDAAGAGEAARQGTLNALTEADLSDAYASGS